MAYSKVEPLAFLRESLYVELFKFFDWFLCKYNLITSLYSILYHAFIIFKLLFSYIFEGFALLDW